MSARIPIINLVPLLFCSFVAVIGESIGNVGIFERDPRAESIVSKWTLIAAEINTIAWCSAAESVVVKTLDGTVYLSNDGGLGWRIPEDFIGKAIGLEQSPVDQDVFFFTDYYKMYWVTEDCGKTIHSFKNIHNFHIDEFKFHSLKRDWILAAPAYDPEKGIYGPSQYLYLSKDLGAHWTFLTDGISVFSWAAKNPSSLKRIPAQRILFGKHSNYAYTDNFFKTTTTIPSKVYTFLMRDFYFLMDMEASISPLVDDPILENEKFRKVKMPETHERFHRILKSSERQVVLSVTQKPGTWANKVIWKGCTFDYNNIYTSDSTGMSYSLSLRNNVGSYTSEFESVNGLDGLYLANVYNSEVISLVESSQIAVHINPMNGKQSRITFNKGGIWESLIPPTYDALGKKRAECEDCSLHLHIKGDSHVRDCSSNEDSEKIEPLQSSSDSPGLILGTGNIGKYLSYKKDEVNTYFSRDGGHSWFEIMKGSYISAIGNHGSIILMVSNQNASEYAYYTWNQGISWHILKIFHEPIKLVGIFTVPSNTALKFILHGRATTGAVVIGIDFSSLSELKPCQLHYLAGDPISDYETWIPSGPTSGSCFMGYKIAYIRCKRLANCFSTHKPEKFFTYSHCSCTEEDWECDFGYERAKNGSCLPIAMKAHDYGPPEECEANKYYTISNGYRKISGNVCEGGVNHESTTKLPCPPSSILLKKQVANFLTFIFLLVVLGISFLRVRLAQIFSKVKTS